MVADIKIHSIHHKTDKVFWKIVKNWGNLKVTTFLKYGYISSYWTQNIFTWKICFISFNWQKLWPQKKAFQKDHNIILENTKNFQPLAQKLGASQFFQLTGQIYVKTACLWLHHFLTVCKALPWKTCTFDLLISKQHLPMKLICCLRKFYKKFSIFFRLNTYKKRCAFSKAISWYILQIIAIANYSNFSEMAVFVKRLYHFWKLSRFPSSGKPF